MSMFDDFTLILPPEVEEKIMFWVDKADKEISGLGDAWLDPHAREIRITSAFLLKQECTGADTELDEKSIASAMFKAHKDEQAGIKRQIKFWWHSHVNMGVFWSATDVTAMEKLGTHGWFCHIVFNKKREKKGAISYPLTLESCGYTRSRIEIDDDIKIRGTAAMSEEQIKILEKDFEDNYSEKKYIMPIYDKDKSYDYDYYRKGGAQETLPIDKKDDDKNLLPTPDDKDVFYEDHRCLLFVDEKDNLVYQQGFHLTYLEYQQKKFPMKIIKEMDDGALRAVSSIVATWKGGEAKRIQNKIDSEFLERGYNQ